MGLLPTEGSGTRSQMHYIIHHVITQLRRGGSGPHYYTILQRGGDASSSSVRPSLKQSNGVKPSNTDASTRTDTCWQYLYTRLRCRRGQELLARIEQGGDKKAYS